MKKRENSTVVIVMPAYNAAQTVKDTFLEIPRHLRKRCILIDDKSTDNTVAIAKKLGIKTFEHPQNIGYGANQKTCYWEALKYNPDVVVMLHPDYQYDGKKIEALIRPILDGKYDFMFGSRMKNSGSARSGGMPLIKFHVNKIVTKIENTILGVDFSEHFSGLRAYSWEVLQSVPWQKFSNDFVFDQEMVVAAIEHRFRIGEISIPTRYHKKSSSINMQRGIIFLLQTFHLLFRYQISLLQKMILKKEAFTL